MDDDSKSWDWMGMNKILQQNNTQMPNDFDRTILAEMDLPFASNKITQCNEMKLKK